ncbi:MAG: alpha/beta fold hydrolase [Burkholderiales bacterium]|nr:alpha/beta fold hydrolase [Burkholderiales bacterium]
MSHILLLPFGTGGAVYPFIWLGRLLRRRGHRVTLVTADLYEQTALNAGLEFRSTRSDEPEQMLADPELWSAGDGGRTPYVHAARAAEGIVNAVGEMIEGDGLPDLMLAPTFNFGARIVREKWRVPLVSVHLYPMMFVSAHAIPLFGPLALRLRAMPLWRRRVILKFRNPLDRHALPAVRSSCAAHGIRAPFSLWGQWWHSPDGVLALFPPWFAEEQPDWPQPRLQWDFPLEDMAAEQPLAPLLRDFLDAGDAPVAFTAGTGQLHAAAFFETAAELARQCGCRAIFITRKPEQLPRNLPDTIFATSYAPFGELLPQVRMLVHHGGVGTLSQCLAAGIPQLVVAMALDQPDNAERIERLGAGLATRLDEFTAQRALPLLRRCLDDGTIRSNAEACAQRMRARADTDALIGWIESRRVPGRCRPPGSPVAGGASPPPVYLVPGLGADSRSFRGPWDEIAGSVCPEWPEYHGEASIAAVARFVADAWHIPDGAVLVATSFGGAIACEIAKFRALRAVVLIASSTVPADFVAVRRMRVLTRILPLSWLQRQLREREGLRRKRWGEPMTPYKCAAFDSLDMFGVCQLSFYRDMFDALSRWDGLPEGNTRVLRIHGRQDGMVRIPDAADLLLDGEHLIALTHARECVDFIKAAIDTDFATSKAASASMR